MSTNSTISIKKADKYKTVYCHWDGYLSYNGVLLFKYYKTYNDVENLISHGDMSSLGESIEKCKFYEDILFNFKSELEWRSQFQYRQLNYVFDCDDNTWYLYEYDYHDEKTDKETYYEKIKLIECLMLEVDDYKNYKQEIRKEKIKRIGYGD